MDPETISLINKLDDKVNAHALILFQVLQVLDEDSLKNVQRRLQHQYESNHYPEPIAGSFRAALSTISLCLGNSSDRRDMFRLIIGGKDDDE